VNRAYTVVNLRYAKCIYKRRVPFARLVIKRSNPIAYLKTAGENTMLWWLDGDQNVSLTVTL